MTKQFFKAKSVFLSVLAAICLLCLCSAAALAAEPVQVFIDGAELQADVAPFIENDRTYVPLRAIGEYLSCHFDYNAQMNTVWMTLYNGEHLVLTIGSRDYLSFEDGKEVTKSIDVPVLERHDRTFVPIRFLVELMGGRVDYADNVVNVVSGLDPATVAGQALNSMTQHIYMTMGGLVYGYYGNNAVARLYELVQACMGEETAEPEAYNRLIIVPGDIENYYYRDCDISFYHGEPLIDEKEGVVLPGLADYAFYMNTWSVPQNGVTLPRLLLHDKTAGNWYICDGMAWDNFFNYMQNMIPRLLFNNVA